MRQPRLTAAALDATPTSAGIHGTERPSLGGGPLSAVTTVYIRVRDIDAIAKEFAVESVEQTWGPREVCLTDPDGNRLRIGMPSA